MDSHTNGHISEALSLKENIFILIWFEQNFVFKFLIVSDNKKLRVDAVVIMLCIIFSST